MKGGPGRKPALNRLLPIESSLERLSMPISLSLDICIVIENINIHDFIWHGGYPFQRDVLCRTVWACRGGGGWYEAAGLVVLAVKR